MASYSVFLIRKVLAIFLTFIAAVTFVFIMVRLVGDPFGTLVLEDPRITPEQIEKIKAVYGLDKPLHEQYIDFILNTFRGEFGYSLHYQRPVMDVIMERLPWTLLLLLPAIIISTILSIYTGMKTAWKHGTRYDVVVTSTALFIRSTPHFWLALLFLMFFGYYLGLFPLAGSVTPAKEFPSVLDYVADIAWHAALPITVLVIREIGMYMLYMRNAMVEVMGQDFVWMAKLKGLAERTVMYRHAARVAILPMVTVTALRFGFMINGAILTETVFSYPGMGRLIFDAIMNDDYFLVQGAFIIMTVTVLLANLVADLLYGILDPRVRVT